MHCIITGIPQVTQLGAASQIHQASFMSSFGYTNFSYLLESRMDTFPKKILRVVDRKQIGKFNFPETQKMSGILENTEKLQEQKQWKVCGLICQYHLSPLQAVPGFTIFTTSFPPLSPCGKPGEIIFCLHRSKMQERGNPIRDRETYRMDKQFSYGTLLLNELLHNLNFSAPGGGKPNCQPWDYPPDQPKSQKRLGR